MSEVVIYSTINWNFLWQAPQELALFLGRSHDVIFVENLTTKSLKIMELANRLKARIKYRGIQQQSLLPTNVKLTPSLLIPWVDSPMWRKLQWKLSHRLIKKNLRGSKIDYIITFIPHPYILTLAKEYKGSKIIYYVLSDYFKLLKCKSDYLQAHAKLVEKADFVFYQSRNMLGSSKEVKLGRKYHHLLPGSCANHLKNSQENRIKSLNVSSFVYAGGIHRYIDVDFVINLLIEFPKAQLKLIGPVLDSKIYNQLVGHPNVTYLGQKTRGDLLNCIKEADIGIIPYLITDYTHSVFPIKIYDYLESGLSVLSSPLPELICWANQRNYPIHFHEKNSINQFAKIFSPSTHPFEIDFKDTWEYKFNYFCSITGITKDNNICKP